jgi:cyanophycinase
MKKETAIGFGFLLIWLLCSPGLFGEESTVGPKNGYLIIMGGMHNPEILAKFDEVLGGRDKPLVFIPTALPDEGLHYAKAWEKGLRDLGFTNITVLHTRDRGVADSEDFVQPIREARGVILGGGRQWRFADSYLNTRTHKELWALLERGGVIIGGSAGATIQGSFLVRGDTKTNTIMIGDHLEGFGFLRNSAIDQHLLKRNRQHDLIEVIEKYPDLLGIGVDEGAAILVHGDQFEVIGTSYVAIYDSKKLIPPNGKFYLLAPGDIFDLKTRTAVRPTQTMTPVDRVKKGEWDKK